MTTPTRRPYTGSCHCGNTAYILHLTLPHTAVPVGPDRRSSPKGVQNFYRCNCTLCQKAGLLHVRPLDPTGDFLLLCPRGDPFAELGDYRVPGGDAHWFFCRTCGMRCFSLRGKGERMRVDPAEIGLDEGGTGGLGGRLKNKLEAGPDGKVDAWRPIPEEGVNFYLSVNGMSLDAGQEGLDLREWNEKGWMLYLDCLGVAGEGLEERPRYERPHEGGVY